jgi:hypothetical protein
MRSLILSVATAVVLTAAVVPGALATEPSGTDAPTPVEVPTPSPTAPGPFEGTIVVDPTFVSGGELPTQPPANAQGPARPAITPPPTDAAIETNATGTGLQVPLLLLAATAAVAALATPGRARRRAGRR